MDILIVDDNSDYLQLMRDVLFTNGYTVHTAETGMAGCRIMTEQDIDLIISDIRMPGIDGLQLHTFTRELHRYKRTPFVFVSAYKDVYENRLRMNPKLDLFLDKTTPVDQVVRTVDQLMFGPFSAQWR
jgi:CheY-like chemotaxis protein